MSEYLKSFVGFDKMPFYITLAGVTYPNPTYHITRICSNISVIEYITDGDGYVVIDDKIHHVRKNMIYFLPSGQNHNYYSDRKNPFQKKMNKKRMTECDFGHTFFYLNRVFKKCYIK